jgi:hypothetical protein
MRCVLLLVLPLAMSCKESSNPTGAHAPATAQTSTDTQSLRRYINLAREPSSVQWKTSKIPGRSDWTLRALFRYARADLDAIEADSKRLPGPPAVPLDVLNTWFPTHLRERYATAPRDPRGVVTPEAILRTPEPFVAADRSPLVHGTVTIFSDEGLLYLDLYTM